jgi:hypothetical protein
MVGALLASEGMCEFVRCVDYEFVPVFQLQEFEANHSSVPFVCQGDPLVGIHASM